MGGGQGAEGIRIGEESWLMVTVVGFGACWEGVDRPCVCVCWGGGDTRPRKAHATRPVHAIN